jgi:peptidoglycan/xylan/chitin deacetylase (PgdA/CDA1 family)
MKKPLLMLCERLNLFPLFNPFTRNKATVFMIHHFCESGVRDLRSLPADILEECLHYLVSSGYRTMSLSEYVNSLTSRQDLYKAVVFTVDDGYSDFLHFGFPVFSKYNVPVAVFISTHFVDGKTRFWWDNVREIVEQCNLSEIELKLDGTTTSYKLRTDIEKEQSIHSLVEKFKTLPGEERPDLINALISAFGISELKGKHNALSWDEIIELQKKGVEFYPHTITHPVLRDCSDSEIECEVCEPKESIGCRLQRPADIFCYPNGRFCDFDERSVEALKRAGYIAAFTAEEGFNRPGSDMFRLCRYGFPQDFLTFRRIVSGLESFTCAARKVTARVLPCSIISVRR